MSIAVAAMLLEDLTVISSDETDGRRAQGLRRFADSLGRTDIRVVTGHDLGGTHRFLADDYITEVPPQPADVIGAVARACESGPALWVGQGPMSNLADVLSVEPHRAEQLTVFQQGFWLDQYRDPSRASHNARLDPAAAGLAIRAAFAPCLVLSDWTDSEEIAVTRDSELFRLVSRPDVPDWARWIAISFQRWFERGRASSKMHDPLTLSAALGCGFVSFDEVRVRIAPDARMYRDRRGRLVRVATGVDYTGFTDWLIAMIATGIDHFEPPAAQPLSLHTESVDPTTAHRTAGAAGLVTDTPQPRTAST
ncbi:nucleoside hydrolase [Nocardia wallacei]|uniref:nucleoside hydrolase n=1 Tax=Nocardia wallacei TaxID=480035 RepID=UPI0024550650|nr:nucleoside hydrolase [Nocardia wallacei]